MSGYCSWVPQIDRLLKVDIRNTRADGSLAPNFGHPDHLDNLPEAAVGGTEESGLQRGGKSRLECGFCYSVVLLRRFLGTQFKDKN